MTKRTSLASERRRIAAGGQRMPGGILDHDAAKALADLREHWPGWPAVKIIAYALLQLRRSNGP